MYNNPMMNTKVTSIVAYLSWVGLILAILLGDREGAKFHLNQALVIQLFSVISYIPIVGWIWGIVLAVLWGIGFCYAWSQVEKEVPIIGKIRILN